MDVILRMLFRKMFFDTTRVEEIKTVDDLCKVSISTEEVARIFAAMNDDADGYGTKEILQIANEVYQEGKNND